jgi:hypothetical protein
MSKERKGVKMKWIDTCENVDGEIGEYFLLANKKTFQFYLGIYKGAGYFEIKPLAGLFSVHDFTHFVSLKDITESLRLGVSEAS